MSVNKTAAGQAAGLGGNDGKLEGNKNRRSKWLILFVVVIGTFMAALDSSIVNIAIAKMMAVFGSDLDTIQWVLSAYTLTLGTVVPLAAFLMDTYGNKRMFILALFLFTAGSFLCGLAWSSSAMIAFRVLQALGGGMIIPVGMTMIMESFYPEERGMALGFWGIAAMAAPAIGPTLGGYIIQYLDWRLIFYINVPIGVFGIIMAEILVDSEARKPWKGFDGVGFITSAAGLVSILYVLGSGAAIDWSDIKNPLLITLGCFCLLMFVINELHHPAPLIDLHILKNREYALSQVLQTVMVFALMGGMYLVPVFLQNLRGYSALQTGLIMLPAAISQALAMPLGGKLFDKWGVKRVALPGLLVLLVSSCLLALINPDTGRDEIVILLAVRGLGLGMAFMPITTAGMNAVAMELAARATTLNNMIKQVSAALAVTVTTTVLQDRLNYNYGRLSEQITVFNQSAASTMAGFQQALVQAGYNPGDAGETARVLLTRLVYRQAYVDAVDYTMMATALVTIAAMLLLLLMREQKTAAGGGT